MIPEIFPAATDSRFVRQVFFSCRKRDCERNFILIHSLKIKIKIKIKIKNE